MTQGVEIELRYELVTRAHEWAVPEDYPVPECVPHEIAAHHLLDVLRNWASRADRPLFVPYNFAIRWIEERPEVGIDPDVCVLDRDVHERYAAFGARELVVFDPLLSEPKSMGGPFALQVWRREGGTFDPVYAGPGAAYCDTLKAWLVAEGRLLQLANDPEGRDRWLTAEEQSRAEAEQSRAYAERLRAERRLLEAELAALRTKIEK